MTPLHVDELHALLSEVMVRNRRSTVGLQFTRRWAHTERLTPCPEEQVLYDDAAEFRPPPPARRRWQGQLTRMALIALADGTGEFQPGGGRHPAAHCREPGLAAGERTMLAQLGGAAGGQTDSAKVDRLLELLEEFPDKMVIFTQFRATPGNARRALAAGRA